MKKLQDIGDVIEGVQCLAESQIGLGGRVEVEVSDHAGKIEVYKGADLELNLEEGELDLACSLEHHLAEDRGGSP